MDTRREYGHADADTDPDADPNTDPNGDADSDDNANANLDQHTRDASNGNGYAVLPLAVP
jgi:hypothetical protein